MKPSLIFLVGLDEWDTWDTIYLRPNISLVAEIQKRVEEALNSESSDIIHQNISEETLRIAGEIFIYLFSCPYNLISNGRTKAIYDKLLTYSLKDLLLFLSRILKTADGKDEKLFDTALSVLTKLKDIKQFSYQKLMELTNEIPFYKTSKY